MGMILQSGSSLTIILAKVKFKALYTAMYTLARGPFLAPFKFLSVLSNVAEYFPNPLLSQSMLGYVSFSLAPLLLGLGLVLCLQCIHLLTISANGSGMRVSSFLGCLYVISSFFF